MDLGDARRLVKECAYKHRNREPLDVVGVEVLAQAAVVVEAHVAELAEESRKLKSKLKSIAVRKGFEDDGHEWSKCLLCGAYRYTGGGEPLLHKPGCLMGKAGTNGKD